MTIGPRELPSRRGHRAGRAGQAAAELEPLVDGPVHPPYTVDAAVELAVDPLVGALPRLLAVVGATSTEDVAAAVSWATAHGVGVVALNPRAHRPTLPAGDGRPRPVLAISRGRLDRVTVDREDRTLRAGVGASWAACHRTAAADGPGPRALLHRPGLVAHGVGSVTKRGGRPGHRGRDGAPARGRGRGRRPVVGLPGPPGPGRRPHRGRPRPVGHRHAAATAGVERGRPDAVRGPDAPPRSRRHAHTIGGAIRITLPGRRAMHRA